MLEIKNVHKTFNKGTINEKKALNGVNLHLDPGDFVTIIGGNGAGKSTTLNMVAGVYPIDQGTIILDGKDISDLPEYKRAYMLGRVFQDPMMGTAAGMQIEENMAMANRRGKKRGLSWGNHKKRKKKCLRKITNARLRTRRSNDIQSRTIIREVQRQGIDTAYGNTEETKTCYY